jgi:diacylglycerol kinase (ATP)
MRVAAIFGPGASPKDLAPFQTTGTTTWLTSLPTAPSEAEAIIILGGDGTIHRQLAALVDLQLPVLVVPCGSGNDFARALGLGMLRASLAAWRAFQSDSSNVRKIDLGQITPEEKSGEAATQQKHHFCCVGGVGIDGEVARRANRLPDWLRAHGGYALSVLPAVFRFAPILMKIQPLISAPRGCAGGDAEPTVLAAFANVSSYGGGMKIAPRARLDDGKLDICVVRNINKLKLLCLFPTIYFGRHLGVSEVEYFQTERLRVETPEPCDVYADGEYVCRTPIEVSVARNALRVIVPSTSAI